MAKEVLTPMMKQFYDLKEKYPECILLFRCGDFYETYGQDAGRHLEYLVSPSHVEAMVRAVPDSWKWPASLIMRWIHTCHAW